MTVSLGEILKYSSYSGAAVIIGGVIRWIFQSYHKISNISGNVQKLNDVHFPEMKQSMKGMQGEFVELKSDVRDLGTQMTAQDRRMDESKESLDNLGVAFTHHLEASADYKIQQAAEQAVVVVSKASSAALTTVAEAAAAAKKVVVEEAELAKQTLSKAIELKK